MSTVHYFDNNATTRVAPEVVEAMLPFFSERYGNASSMHAFGGDVHKDMEAARAKVAAFLHCDPMEVVFTSCGSESDNNAIFGAVEALGEGTTVITSKVEHPAVLQPCKWLEEHGARIERIGVHKDGTLDMDAYRAALEIPGPKLVTLMWANNETGVLFPIRECAVLAKAAGAVFHTDATQSAGKLAEVDMSVCPADMLSFSGHKLHAPRASACCSCAAAPRCGRSSSAATRSAAAAPAPRTSPTSWASARPSNSPWRRSAPVKSTACALSATVCRKASSKSRRPS